MGSVKSKDGVTIKNEMHYPEGGEVKAVVVVCHGFGEHRGSYRKLAERLCEDGYASVLFDQRGHGDLPREKLGLLRSYDCFLDDIDSVTEDARLAFPGAPLVLFGHSMGGNIAANYLLRRSSSPFVCGVLESPWLGLYHAEPVLGRIVSALSYLFPNVPLPSSKTKLSPDQLTNEPKAQEENAEDSLYHNRMSTRMFREIDKGCRYAIENAARLSTPVFLAVGKNDRVVSNEAIDRFYHACRGKVTRKDYDCRHAIHSDSEREIYFDDMARFLDSNCHALRS